MLAHSFLRCGRSISPNIRRRTIWRIHSCRACGVWSTRPKSLPPSVAVLVGTATRLLCEAHAAARRLLAVLPRHETLLLEATTGAAATTR